VRIRIRIGSEYAGDRETETFTDSTFAEAVAALQGMHDGLHKGETVFVVNTHAETRTAQGDGRTARTLTYQQGEPIFGEEVAIYGRWVFQEHFANAQVGWASGGSMSTEEARLKLELITLAISIAEAANAEPPCAKCEAQRAENEARFSKPSLKLGKAKPAFKQN
jgi:hypothetical protein